jgi:hypothetical protein
MAIKTRGGIVGTRPPFTPCTSLLVPAFNSAVDPFFVLHYSHQLNLVASCLTRAATTPYWCLEGWPDGAEAKPFRTSGLHGELFN